jgi:hypothetical protein
MIRDLNILFKSNFKWVLCILCFIGFFVILISLYTFPDLSIDYLGYHYIVEKLRNDYISKYIILLTNLGGTFILVSICIGSIIFIRDKIYCKYIIINLLLITLINQVIKIIIERPRPEIII